MRKAAHAVGLNVAVGNVSRHRHKTGRDNVERVGRELREKLVGEEGSEGAYLAN
jgi:hypothetical protein